MTNPAAGAVNLGSAYGEVLIDFSNVERQLNSAFNTAQRSIAGFMDRTGASLQRIGTAITVATLPVAGFVKQGISAFANFEEVLAEIEARTGATADQMKIVEATALDMGKKTAFSATQAAEGMLQLLASGMDTNQAIAALKPTLDLAAAGHVGLAEAASVVTTILGQFNLKADQSGRVADALARASAASRAEISDLGQAFSNVGPIANRFGLSVEDTAAILAEFANNGIMGAEAGTQLKSMLTNLTRPTKDVQDMWKQLGISLYDARGNIRPLNTVIQELNRKLGTLTEQQRNEAVTTLAGSFGQMGLETLLASNGFDTMTASMEKQAGAAKVAGAWFTTLKGKIENLRGSLETVLIRIFKPFANNILKPIIDRATEFLNWVNDMIAASPQLAEQIAMVLTGIVLLGPGLVAVGTGLRIVSALMKTFSLGSALATLGPLAPLLLGVAAATGVLYAAYKTNFLGFTDFVNGFVGEVGRIIETVRGFIGRVREVGLGEALTEFYAQGGRFQKTGRGVVRGILDIVGAIGGFIKIVQKNGFIAAWEQVFTTLGDGSSWIGNILQSFGMAQGRAEGIGRVINRLATIFMTGVQAVRSFVTGLVNAFQSGGFRGAFNYLKEAAINGLPIFLEGLSTLISGVWGWIKEQTPTFASNLGEMVGAGLRFMADAIITYAPGVIGGLLKLLAALAVWVVTTGIPEFLKFADSFIQNFVEGLAGGFGDVDWNQVWITVWNALKTAAGATLAFLWNAGVWVRARIILPMFDYLKEVDWGEAVRDLWNNFKKALGVGLSLLWTASVWVRAHIVMPIFNYLKEVDWGEATTSLWNNFKKSLGLMLALLWNASTWTREHILMPIWNYIKGIDWDQIGRDIVQGFKDGVQGAWDSLGIEGFFKDLWDKIPQWIRDRMDSHSPSQVMWNIGADIVAGLQNGINENAQGAITAAMNMAGAIHAQVQGAQASLAALSAMAARPVGMGAGVAALANPYGAGNTIHNTNFGGLNVIVPHNAIPQTNNPVQQGQGIGRGVQQALNRRGSGTRRP